MSRSQRLTFLAIAAVIAIGAVILLTTSGGDDEPANTGAQATATPAATESAAPGAIETATPEPTPTPTPTPASPLITPDKLVKLRVTEGETVRFRVRADTTDEIHVHGYDLMQDIEPGKTISFSFKADIVGIFTIELESAEDEIAQLRVDPA